MSISTRKGDKGMTSLMYNRPVSKCDLRVEACGAVDELTAVLGLARARAVERAVGEQLLGIQRDLVILMGELATDPADLVRYEKDGYARVTPALTARLDEMVKELEAQSARPGQWAIPGTDESSAALHMARAVCRRAERRVWALAAAGQLPNVEITVFLNRLSDVCWLLARRAEARLEPPSANLVT